MPEQFHLLPPIITGYGASKCIKCGTTLDHSYTENYTLNEAAWGGRIDRCSPTATAKRRCPAWSYPGHNSWERELRSVADGRQCALDIGHASNHELVGPWSSTLIGLTHEETMARIAGSTEAVNHPAHYGGANNVYEAIKIIEALGLDFHLGNAFKYLARAGKKDPAKEIEDLEKAAWYLARAIETRKAARK